MPASQIPLENAATEAPGTPKKEVPAENVLLLKTPVKNLREFGFQGQGKSPRRKR